MPFDLNSFISSVTPKGSAVGSLMNSTAPKKPSLFTPSAPLKQSTVPTPSANPGATSAVDKPSVSTPAAQAYIKSQTPSTPSTPAQQPTPATPASTPPPSTTPSSDTSLDSYRTYLSQYADSLKPSDELKTANVALAKANNDIDTRTLDSRRESEATLDTPGGLKAGAETAEGAVRRRNASELADLGVVQSGAARNVSALTDTSNTNSSNFKNLLDLSKPIQIGDSYVDPTTGKTIYQKPQAGFNLSEGEARYEVNPTTGKYEKIASVAKTATPSAGGNITGFSGTLSPLAQAVQNGTITIDKIPAAQRSQIAAELATSGSQTGRQQSLSTSLDVVNGLLGTNTDAITGIGQNPLNALGLSNSKALNLYNQLQGILSLENRQQLKGQGAISDFEFKVLSDAASSLSRNLNNKDFRDTLSKIKDVLEGKYAQTNAGGTNGAPASTTGGAVDPDYQAYLTAIGQ